MALETLPLGIWLMCMDSGPSVILVAGHAQSGRGFLESDGARTVRRVACLAAAFGHGGVRHFLQQPRRLGAVGGMAEHAAALYGIAAVGLPEGVPARFMAGGAEGVLALNEEGGMVGCVVQMAFLAPFFHRGMDMGLLKFFPDMACEAGLLLFRLQKPGKGRIVDLVTLEALPLADGAVH